MVHENDVWALGSTVLGKFWNNDEQPAVLFRVIHRTKHYATFQRIDDLSVVYRKRLLKQRGEWCILIGPLWMHPILKPSVPEGPGFPSSSEPSSSSGAGAPPSSSPDQAASG